MDVSGSLSEGTLVHARQALEYIVNMDLQGGQDDRRWDSYLSLLDIGLSRRVHHLAVGDGRVA